MSRFTIQRDGIREPVWFDLEFTPIADDDCIVQGVMLIASETIDRVQALRDLRCWRERVDLAVDAVVVGTWEIDFATETVSSDERFARLHGTEPAVVRAGAEKYIFISGIHPDERDRVKAEFDRAKERGHYRCQNRVVGEGRLRWVVASGRVLMDEDGQRLSFSGVGVDVTHQVETASVLAESELRFRTYTETLP